MNSYATSISSNYKEMLSFVEMFPVKRYYTLNLPWII